jgi:hypothetical protein
MHSKSRNDESPSTLHGEHDGSHGLKLCSRSKRQKKSSHSHYDKRHLDDEPSSIHVANHAILHDSGSGKDGQKGDNKGEMRRFDSITKVVEGKETKVVKGNGKDHDDDENGQRGGDESLNKNDFSVLCVMGGWPKIGSCCNGRNYVISYSVLSNTRRPALTTPPKEQKNAPRQLPSFLDPESRRQGNFLRVS